MTGRATSCETNEGGRYGGEGGAKLGGQEVGGAGAWFDKGDAERGNNVLLRGHDRCMTELN